MGYTSTFKQLGTTTNDSAATGYIGEYIEAKLLAASAESMTTSTSNTLASIAPTAGDWDVSGVIGYIPAATTSVTILSSHISLTDNTTSGADDNGSSQFATAANVMVNACVLATPIRRISIAATTTVYLVARATFTVSTMTAFGTIRGRRMR